MEADMRLITAVVMAGAASLVSVSPCAAAALPTVTAAVKTAVPATLVDVHWRRRDSRHGGHVWRHGRVVSGIATGSFLATTSYAHCDYYGCVFPPPYPRFSYGGYPKCPADRDAFDPYGKAYVPVGSAYCAGGYVGY
jgi:hypothetical protein